MGTVNTFIWGIRQGFKTHTALYPEKARLVGSDVNIYESVVTHFNEGKDSIFRQCRKDLYFVIKAGNYQLYSLVISDHMDVVGRTSYLVFSLCVPYGQQIQGGGIGALQLIKQLYKKKNSDYTVDRNMFTMQQVEEITSSLQTVPRKHGFKNASNAIFFFNEESQLNNEFFDYTGNEIYFIPETSNHEIVQQLKAGGFRVQNLKEIGIANQRIAEQLKEFRQLLSEQKDTEISKAQMLHNAISSYLQPDENSKFKQWLTRVNRDGLVAKNFGEFKIELEKMRGGSFQYDPSKASAILTETPEILQKLSEEQHSFFENYRKGFSTKTSQDKKNKLSELITSAERNRWALDPAELEKYSPYTDLLNYDQQTKVATWKKAYNSESVVRQLKKVQKLAHEIKNASNSDLKKKKEDFKSAVDDLEFKVKNLPEDKTKNNLLENDDYLYLISRKWLPKERKINLTMLSLVVGIIVLSLGCLIYFNPDLFKSTSNPDITADSDNDGIKDAIDVEPKTEWLDNNYKYELKDYVTEYGEINTDLTRSLCDCFTFPDKKNRDILRCEDNEKYFFNTEDSTLYFYNKEENKFYKNGGKDSIALKNSADDKVAKFYEDNILHISERAEKHEPEADQDEVLVVISYNNTSYKLKEGFTTEEGLKFNKAYWRFFNSTWKKSDDQKSWKAVQENDISYLLTKVATEIKKDASKQGETAEQKKKREYNEAVNRLKSQGYKQGSPGAGQQVAQSTILTNPQGQTVNFWKPKAEEKIEVPNGKQDWWAQFLDEDGNSQDEIICRNIDEIKRRQKETGKNRDKVISAAKPLGCW